jgi:hypothetical protein
MNVGRGDRIRGVFKLMVNVSLLLGIDSSGGFDSPRTWFLLGIYSSLYEMSMRYTWKEREAHVLQKMKVYSSI